MAKKIVDASGEAQIEVKIERKQSESKSFRAYVILEDAIADKALRLAVIEALRAGGVF